MKVSKSTKDLILCEKFSNPSPDDPYLIPLCFLFIFLSSNSSRYSIGLTANVIVPKLFFLVFFFCSKNVPENVLAIKSFINLRCSYNLKHYFFELIFRRVPVWIRNKHEIQRFTVCVCQHMKNFDFFNLILFKSFLNIFLRKTKCFNDFKKQTFQ